MFTCNKCNKDFDFKYLLKKHQNRKTACNTEENINNVHKNKIEIIKNGNNIGIKKINAKYKELIKRRKEYLTLILKFVVTPVLFSPVPVTVFAVVASAYGGLI